MCQKSLENRASLWYYNSVKIFLSMFLQIYHESEVRIMNVEALIAYLGAWLKALLKGIENVFTWVQTLGEETTTEAPAAE